MSFSAWWCLTSGIVDVRCAVLAPASSVLPSSSERTLREWGVEPGCAVVVGGGWHTVGCLRNQTPLAPVAGRSVRIAAGVGACSLRGCFAGWWGGLCWWARYPDDPLWVGGVWFVNSGREHLVAIREFRHCGGCLSSWCLVLKCFVAVSL
jgi:hypothetical protein